MAKKLARILRLTAASGLPYSPTNHARPEAYDEPEPSSDRPHNETTFKAMGKFLKTDNRQTLESLYDDYGSAYQKVPLITKQEVQAVLEVVKSPKGVRAKPEVFYDNSFVQKIDASGSINYLYNKFAPENDNSR